MKKFILLLALFPFLHSSSYRVDYVRCKPQEIIVAHEDEEIQISLFNTKITKQEGWNKACSLMKEAKSLRIEIDPSSKIEDVIPVYLFADNILVQEELIRDGYAYPMIHNPEYTYEERLEAAIKTTSVMAKPSQKEVDHGRAMVAPIYLLIVLFLWILMLGRLWRKRRKKMKVKLRKTPVHSS